MLASKFPFLFGGTFIEAECDEWGTPRAVAFPFLFGGTFIEALIKGFIRGLIGYFPSFSEGLSLRLRLLKNGGAVLFAHFPSFSEGLSLRPPKSPST